MSFNRYWRELYGRWKASFEGLKTRMVKSEVDEALLYSCASRALLRTHYIIRSVPHTTEYYFEPLEPDADLETAAFFRTTTFSN